MALNALELVEDLQARSDLSAKDASAVVYTIGRAVESATSNLVTRDQFDARMAELRGELRTDMAELRGELRSEMAALRGEIRTTWRPFEPSSRP